MLKDLGKVVAGSVLGDASAALGIIRRQGLGKMRHLNTNYLWVQEKNARKEISYEKVLGTENVADLMTKHLDGATLEKLTSKLGTELRDDKSRIALDLDVLTGQLDYVKTRIAADYGDQRKFNVWTRRDRASLTYRNTAKGGPHTKEIRYRVTIDNGSGSIVNFEKTDGEDTGRHKLLPYGPTDITTMMVYNDQRRTVPSA